MPYLSASAVVIQYEGALYQVYCPFLYNTISTIRNLSISNKSAPIRPGLLKFYVNAISIKLTKHE